MILAPSACALALAVFTQSMVPAMTDQPNALTLDVQEHAGVIEVQLIGLSARVQAVSYTLEVTGQSNARHRGSTTLAAGNRAVLSTMRTKASLGWCVTLIAQEEGREPYAVTRGTCTAE